MFLLTKKIEGEPEYTEQIIIDSEANIKEILGIKDDNIRYFEYKSYGSDGGSGHYFDKSWWKTIYIDVSPVKVNLGIKSYLEDKDGLIKLWNQRRMGLEDKVIDVVSGMCDAIDGLLYYARSELALKDIEMFESYISDGHNLIDEIEPEENE